MLTFIFLAAGAILVIAVFLVAYSANQRKRARQSGEPEVSSQVTGSGSPKVGRPTGAN